MQRLDGDWVEHHVINLTASPRTMNSVNLSISNSKLFVCENMTNKLYTYNTDGTQIDELDRGRGYGDAISCPYLCGSDEEGAVLIAEWGKDRLLVRNCASDWHVLYLRPRVRKPVSVALLDEELFVVSTRLDGKQKLINYYKTNVDSSGTYYSF